MLTDGTERPIQRPKDEGEQKEHYSGKRKRHTSKHVTITPPKTQRILAVSEEAPGTMHDKKILDEEKLSCTTELQVRADRGLQGLSIGNAEIIIPFKRKRKKKGEPKDELTEQEKEANTLLSKTRISIEHSNAGFKRNRSVTDLLRTTRQGMSDSLALVAMGLHNLRVSLRVSYQYSPEPMTGGCYHMKSLPYWGRSLLSVITCHVTYDSFYSDQKGSGNAPR